MYIQQKLMNTKAKYTHVQLANFILIRYPQTRVLIDDWKAEPLALSRK
jgi:hypothetical protein